MHLPCKQVDVGAYAEFRIRERYPPLCPFPATRNPGAGQDFTDLAAAVQLRLRVAVGLQALQRCSGLLNRRARGSTVATHHFGGGTWIEKFMRSLACPARRIKLLPSASSSVSFQRSRSSITRARRFERRR